MCPRSTAVGGGSHFLLRSGPNNAANSEVHMKASLHTYDVAENRTFLLLITCPQTRACTTAQVLGVFVPGTSRLRQGEVHFGLPFSGDAKVEVLVQAIFCTDLLA